MDFLAVVIVNLAWLIPGPPHRWAKILKAERMAAKVACERYGIAFRGRR